jgi:pimeloyl-ACP methyl ester carboxylesterase
MGMDTRTCDLPEAACPAVCPFDQQQTPALSLAEAQARFEREAVPGVCDTGHYRCSYYSWGTGPPIVMIPGMADDRLSFLFVSALLSKYFRCIAYDLPSGAGDGAKLRRVGHAELVQDLFFLLDHLQLQQTYLLGSSFGGTIALAAMHAQPKRFPRAVLQGSFARRPLRLVENFLARMSRYWLGTMRLVPGRATALRHFHFAPFKDRPADVWQYFLYRSNLPPISAVAHRALLIHQIDLRPLLVDIHQPVLLICGDNDPLVGPACEEELLHGLPNAGRAQVSGCGHNPIFTHPEILAELVRQFLTPPSAADGQESKS